MATRVALFLLPLIGLTAWAQAPAPQAPSDVEKALRDRVTEFFQYHVTGEYKKAFPMVADDTQEAYFAQGKMKLKSFKVDSVQFLDPGFTKARVNLTVVRDWQVRMQNNEAIIPMATDWKIEDGKWVWFYDLKDRWLTPMGPSNVEAPKRNADGTIDLPKNFSDEVIAARARALLQQSGIDKRMVNLDAGKPSSERVIFTNSAQGPVGLSLAGVPQIPGFKAELDKQDVASGGTANLTLSYDSKDTTPQAPFMIQVVTEPFNQAFNIQVVLGKQPEQ